MPKIQLQMFRIYERDHQRWGYTPRRTQILCNDSMRPSCHRPPAYHRPSDSVVVRIAQTTTRNPYRRGWALFGRRHLQPHPRLTAADSPPSFLLLDPGTRDHYALQSNYASYCSFGEYAHLVLESSPISPFVRGELPSADQHLQLPHTSIGNSALNFHHLFSP